MTDPPVDPSAPAAAPGAARRALLLGAALGFAVEWAILRRVGETLLTTTGVLLSDGAATSVHLWTV